MIDRMSRDDIKELTGKIIGDMEVRNQMGNGFQEVYSGIAAPSESVILPSFLDCVL